MLHATKQRILDGITVHCTKHMRALVHSLEFFAKIAREKCHSEARCENTLELANAESLLQSQTRCENTLELTI